MESERVIDGRWRIVARAPTAGGVERWRAVAVDTGEPVELLTLGRTSDPSARSAFLDAHRQLAELTEPALVRTHAVVQEGRRVWVVRDPLEDPTLARIDGPLDAGDVAAIGVLLLPAVLAAGAATGGALRPDDVGLDARGHPVLAPRGAPLTAVARSTTRAVAPEAFTGAALDGRAGLYGLGALLYQLTTGTPADVGGSDVRRAPPPPPSALRPGLPDALDRAVLALLSPDPADRPAALPLLQSIASPPIDLRRLARAPRAGTVRYTASAPRQGASARIEPPGATVVVDADALAGLSPGQASLAAGLAGIPMATLDQLIAQGLPLVVEGHRGGAAARARARELDATHPLPIGWAGAPGVPVWLAWITMGLVAMGSLGLASALVLLLGVLSAVPVLVAAAALLAVGGWFAAQASASRGRHLAAADAHEIADRQRVALAIGGRAQPIWDRIATLRVQLAELDLPEAAATDLRAALRDVERRLEGLAKVSDAAERALAQVDGSALRARLQALSTRAPSDDKARAERDRLVRTVADLDAVVGRRTAVERELTEVHDALNEVAGVFGQLGRADAPAAGLSELTASTRNVREAIADALPGEGAARAAAARRVPEG